MLRASAVLLMAALGLAVASPSVAAENPASSPASAAPAAGLPLCDTAAGLTADGLPREALALLAGASSQCAAESTAAEQAKDTAQGLAARATTLAASDDPSWATVDDLLTRAETLDQAVGTEAGDEPTSAAIDATAAAAAEALGTQDPSTLSRSWVEDTKAVWSDFADPYLTSLTTLLLVVLGTMALAVAIGRLLVLLPFTNTWAVFRRSRRRARTWIPVAAWGMALLVGLYAALVLPEDVAGTTTDAWALLSFTYLLAFAAVLMWWTLATRMRISVSVAGKSDDAGASEVIALLRELGAEGPAGLEVPRGTDVDVLAGKNIVEKPTGWISAALSLVQSILGFTPWRVVIDDNTDDDETYVIVTRNGRSHGSALITGKPWGDQGPAVDRSKMAAAFVLVSLSEGYAESDFAGLAGATAWRSVGYQYVASSSRSLPPEQKKFLLLRAIDADPANKLAQISLKHEQYRQADDPVELAAYRQWLSDLATNVGNLRALQLRNRYTGLAVSINRDALVAWEGRSSWTSVSPSAETIEAAQQLKASLEACRDLRLARSIAAAATPLLVFTHVWLPTSLARIPRTPTRTYNEVGIDALLHDPLDPPSRGRAQIEALAQVTALDQELDEAYADPTFTYLRKLPAWTDSLGLPPRALTEVEPFVRYVDTFKALGLETVEKLRDTLLSEGDLAHALGIRPIACRRLLSAVDLIGLFASESLRPQRIEIFAGLWDLGIHNVAELRADPRDAATLAASVAATIQEGRRPLPDLLALEEWILLMRTNVGPGAPQLTPQIS